MSDMFEPTAPEIVTESPVDPVVESTPEPTAHTDAWRTEAGRKGAKRIHELIEAGRQYEQEHGLKSGRQRLRQLIELGKRHEEERGAAAPGRKRRGSRLSRAERDEVVATLLRCLVRIAKPSFRPELTKLAEALAPDAPKVEASQAA